MDIAGKANGEQVETLSRADETVLHIRGSKLTNTTEVSGGTTSGGRSAKETRASVWSEPSPRMNGITHSAFVGSMLIAHSLLGHLGRPC